MSDPDVMEPELIPTEAKPSQSKPDIDVEDLSNKKLLLLHAELHSFWKEHESGREVEDWDRDSLVDVHADVRSELEARDLPHQELNGLDDTDTKRISEGVKTQLKEFIALSRQGYFWDEFYIVPRDDGSALVVPTDEAKERAKKKLDMPDELAVDLEEYR